MRDPKRIPVILDAIQKVWEKHPDLRLGQMIVNAPIDAAHHEFDSDLFYIEDADLVAAIQRICKKDGGK